MGNRVKHTEYGKFLCDLNTPGRSALMRPIFLINIALFLWITLAKCMKTLK